MPRHCERPGCSQPADAIYGMSAATLSVWLEPYDEEIAARVGVLCRHHADAMVVPRGWTLEDRRDPKPQLFRTAHAPATPPAPERAVTDLTPPTPESPAGQPPAKPRPKRPRKRADETGQLELVPTTEAATELVSEPPSGELPPEDVPPDATPFSPWRPKFDQTDDLEGLLQARSPLLARAFRGRRDQPTTDH